MNLRDLFCEEWANSLIDVIFEENFYADGLKIQGYRFFFYVNDHTPSYIPVEKGKSMAKFELGHAELVKSRRFKAKEIAEIGKIVLRNLEFFKSEWDEYFNCVLNQRMQSIFGSMI